jgi:hypothetical protein
VNIEWKLIIDTLTIFGGALAWLYQWRYGWFRANLRSDLDILKELESLGKEEKNYKILKAHIDATIIKQYSCPHSSRWHKVFQKDFILGMLFLIGSFGWIWHIVQAGFTWWRVLIAISFAFTGFDFIWISRANVGTHFHKQASRLSLAS